MGAHRGVRCGPALQENKIVYVYMDVWMSGKVAVSMTMAVLGVLEQEWGTQWCL